MPTHPRVTDHRHCKMSRGTRGKGRTMLNAALGMMSMLPVVFGVAGYVMVSR
jgi:hypothetical protein